MSKLIQWFKRLYKRDLFGYTREDIFKHLHNRHTSLTYIRLDPGDKWELHVNGEMFTEGEVLPDAEAVEGFLCGSERSL